MVFRCLCYFVFVVTAVLFSPYLCGASFIVLVIVFALYFCRGCLWC